MLKIIFKFYKSANFPELDIFNSCIMSSSFKIVSKVRFSYLSKLSNLDWAPNPKNRPKLQFIPHFT